MYFLIKYYWVVLILLIYINQLLFCNYLKILNGFYPSNLYKDKSFAILKISNFTSGHKYINNIFQRNKKYT